MRDLFAPPIIGPFVEPNGLQGQQGHTGAAITWTSAGAAFRLDVIHTKGIWHDTLGFQQLPDLNFEEFLWHCFAHSSRLVDFLNELRPYFRPCHGAPTLARAGEWINPKLANAGFSIGLPKFRNNGCLRIPIVWIFGGNVAQYGSRRLYSRIDFIDWTPNESRLLKQPHDCWGTGAQSLKRYLYQLLDTGCEPLLTEKGNSRMTEVYQNALSKRPKVRPQIRLTNCERDSVSDLRKALPSFSHPILSEFIEKIDQLSEKAYAGLLRTCVSRDQEIAACALLKQRRLPEYGRRNLVEKFIDNEWLMVWPVCANEAQLVLDTASSWTGYNEILRRALHFENPELMSAILEIMPPVSVEVARSIVESAFEKGKEDLALRILDIPSIQPVRNECMLRCFTDSLSGYRLNKNLALRLLDLGVRPIKHIDPDGFVLFDPRRPLLEEENLEILKKVVEFEPLTENSISRLFGNGFFEPGQTQAWLFSESRKISGHRDRMSLVVFRATIAFIRTGSKESLELLVQGFSEGAALNDTPISKYEEWKLLRGRGWMEEQGHWIDLIGYLSNQGRKADVEFLKQLKRGKNKTGGIVSSVSKP